MYDCALRVQHAEPEGPWSREHASPPERRPRRGDRASRSWAETKGELTLLLGPLLIAPDAAEAAAEAGRRLDAMDPPVRHRYVHVFVQVLPLENEARARALARCLVRTGVSCLSVSVGIALLARLGEPRDTSDLKTLSLLRALVRPVIRALDVLDRPAAALLALRNQEVSPELAALITALTAAHDEAAVRSRLIALPGDVTPDVARRVAEATRMTELLSAAVPVRGTSALRAVPEGGASGPRAVPEGGAPGLRAVPEGGTPPDPQAGELLAQAARLLFRMTSVRDYVAEILSYPDAVPAYEALARGAGLLAPTLDHYGLLLSAVQELRTGTGALHGWGPGRREAVLARLTAVLNRPEWRAVPDDRDAEDPGVRWRAGWARRARAQALRDPRVPTERLRVEVFERDPVDRGTIEVRILVDGRPLVPELFGRGPADAPEDLLDRGLLRAGAEPREVRLAEAYCTEGCCGALYVTIRRDGDEVVWADWRCPPPPGLPFDPPVVRETPELRFDAAAYDAEIARAEGDTGWAWPARRAARLIAAGARARPDLLTRWGLRLGWSGTDFRNPDETLLSLMYDTEDGSPGQFLWRMPDDGTPPEDRAAAALHRLATVDPRTV